MSESAFALPEATRRGRGRAAWAERLARFAQSGLSPIQFCAAEGLALPSFYAWRRRLAADNPGPAARPGDAHPGPRLVPVSLGPAAAVELVLPGGAVLRLGPGCDLAFVRALIEALGGAPC